MKAFAGYLIIISLIAFAVTVTDKRLAKHKLWRIPEKTLFTIAVLGGSAAMYITMLAVRHKTRHKRFMIGLPLIMLAQGTAAVFVKFTS